MRNTAIVSLLVLALAGCSSTDSRKIDYKSARSLPTLEVPPDLVLPSVDNRYALPEAGKSGSTTYSGYTQTRGSVAEAGSVLPQAKGARIERAGSQRWLVVDLPAAQVWPNLKEFWQEMGFIVNLEASELGVMETDWAENRANIPDGVIRGFLGRALGSLYSTAERDKFRARLEPTVDGRGTEIYVSHKGMIEVYTGTESGGDEGKGRTAWQPRPPDPELEAEMLRRLMLRFGADEAVAKSELASTKSEQARLGKAADGAPALAFDEPFDRAWRRVGLALDRIGFVVEDRDRAGGLYYVRYADSEVAGKEKGLLSRLAFWRSDEEKAKAEKYRVHVVGQGEGSQAAIYLEDGSPAADETGARIARLLHEQLK